MAIEALKRESIIIFISGLNLHKSPTVIQDAIASKEASGPTPIIAVVDSDASKLIGVVPYFDMKDVNGFTSVRTSIGEYRGIPFEPVSTNYQPEAWKDQRGRSIQATYVTSTQDIVTLRLSNGKLSTMALSKLNEDSRKRIKHLAAE